jgi:hypothetical protein
MALESSDREPDFECHPSIPPVETTMIGLVTRSGWNTRPEVTESDSEAVDSEIVPSQRGRGEPRTEEALPPVLQYRKLDQNGDEIKLVENSQREQTTRIAGS